MPEVRSQAPFMGRAFEEAGHSQDSEDWMAKADITFLLECAGSFAEIMCHAMHFAFLKLHFVNG